MGLQGNLRKIMIPLWLSENLSLNFLSLAYATIFCEQGSPGLESQGSPGLESSEFWDAEEFGLAAFSNFHGVNVSNPRVPTGHSLVHASPEDVTTVSHKAAQTHST